MVEEQISSQIGDAAPERSERELAEEAGARLLVGGRVEYTGNGSTGVLVEMGLPLGEQGPLLSRVLLDGRETPNFIKTKYLIPSTSVAAEFEEVHPLDALLDSLPHEDLTDMANVPALLRALVVAQIYTARAAENQRPAFPQYLPALVGSALAVNAVALLLIISLLSGAK